MMFSDNTKIGLTLVSLGVLFLLLGVILLFDSGLLAIGNILFLAGIPFLIGWTTTLSLFNPMRKGRTRGVVCFLLGVLLVLYRWPVVGMVVELFGMFEMFGRFLGQIVTVARQFPYIGPILSMPVVKTVVDKLAGVQERRPPV
jgi:hypothetical protein